MKKIILSLLLFINCGVFSQTWTTAQLAQANTAKDIPELSNIEKEIIKYINLARLFPKEFAKIEVANYSGSVQFFTDVSKSPYKVTLLKELNSMTPVEALYFDKTLYENAKCHTAEQGKNGEVGHKRTKCKDALFTECCSYGMDNAKDVTMQWLIDDKHADLGHRKNCLGKRYKKIGVSEHSHPKWNTGSTADFS